MSYEHAKARFIPPSDPPMIKATGGRRASKSVAVIENVSMSVNICKLIRTKTTKWVLRGLKSSYLHTTVVTLALTLRRTVSHMSARRSWWHVDTILAWGTRVHSLDGVTVDWIVRLQQRLLRPGLDVFEEMLFILSSMLMP
jgi:hypothetical protein